LRSQIPSKATTILLHYTSQHKLTPTDYYRLTCKYIAFPTAQVRDVRVGINKREPHLILISTYNITQHWQYQDTHKL